MYEEMSDVEESKMSCGHHTFGAPMREEQDFETVPQSWASWITVDDGRTVEQVRMDQSKKMASTTQTAARLSSGIENPTLLQQMNLFMQIDEVNDDQQEADKCIPYSPASTLPKQIVKKRRNNNISQVPPARPLTRKNPRQRLTTSQSASETRNTGATNNCPTSAAEVFPSFGRLSSRSRGATSSGSQQISGKKIVAGSRRERHSIGDKLKMAFGVKQAPEPLRLGEKTAKLLHAVDCMNKSNIQATN